MLSAVLDLVLPRLCVACHAPDRLGFCLRCRPVEPPLVSNALGFPLAAAGEYDGSLRTALLSYKERGRRDLAPVLGALLSTALDVVPAAGTVLVPVPSSRVARRRRGGEHVTRLARHSGRPVRSPLSLARAVQDSAGLDVAQRQANLAGALTSRPPGRCARAVLVDDIATTGATLTEAARALSDAGWEVAAAAAIAVTRRRDGEDRWRVASRGSSVGAT